MNKTFLKLKEIHEVRNSSSASKILKKVTPKYVRVNLPQTEDNKINIFKAVEKRDILFSQKKQ